MNKIKFKQIAFPSSNKSFVKGDGSIDFNNYVILDENNSEGVIILTEGKYHQIKRMFGCYGAKVVELNRICMGNLYLPKELVLGTIKEATQDELQKIQGLK